MSVDWTNEAAAAAALRANGVETDLVDGPLHKYAKAAVQEIAARGLGPLSGASFVLFGSGSLLTLDPPAASVSTIVEEGITLTAVTDYRLRPGGRYLERLSYGFPTNWHGRVTGTIAVGAADERYDRVVTDLVKLTLQYSGLDSQRDGDYGEESMGARGGGGQRNYQSERDTLISELAPGFSFA